VTQESATVSTSSQRVHTSLTVVVERVDFDASACTLHVKGRNVEENAHVKLGAYHTLDLEMNRKFTLHKSEWDSVDLDRLDQALDVTQHADVAAVIMHEGLAHLCLLTSAMTIVRAKIDMQIPRKRHAHQSQHDKGIVRFFDAITQAFLRHVNLQVVKCVIIASRGFLGEQFFAHLLSCAETRGLRQIADNKSKFLLVPASSGFKHSLREVLADQSVASRLADTKAQFEVQALENFFQLLSTEPSRAFYGLKHVQMANDALAIQCLLLCDSLFRSNDIEQRRKYVQLVDSVKSQGGIVRIFSSLHVSGEQLNQLTGIAAILKFGLPELEDEDLSDSDDHEGNS